MAGRMKATDRTGEDAPRIVPECLREAREARGYSLIEFAEIIGISKQALSQLEIGHTSPSPETFEKIVRATGQPLAFFTRPRPRARDLFGATFWRSLKRLNEPERLRIARRLDWLHDIVAYLERYVDLPALDLPAFPWFDPEVANDEDVEKAAASLREHWRLGIGPISNVCELMEAKGVIVFRETVNSPDMSAVSRWQAGRPVVCLSADKANTIRSRYDAAHELGHLVLHAGIQLDARNLNLLERQANRFAGAFLLPAESFSREVVSTSLDYFFTLKKRWKVSAQAMIYRCKDLGLLKEHQVKYLWRQINGRNMRAVEYLDKEFEPEEPIVLKGCIQLLLDNSVVTKPMLKEAIMLNEADIESICGMPPQSLSNVVPLHLKPREGVA